MTIHRIYASNSYRENIQIWNGPIYTGKHVGLISGKDQAGKTIDYNFCVEPSVHTLLMGHSESAGWTSGSYFDVQVGGAQIAHALLDRLNLESLTVYRELLHFNIMSSLHASHP